MKRNRFIYLEAFKRARRLSCICHFTFQTATRAKTGLGKSRYQEPPLQGKSWRCQHPISFYTHLCDQFWSMTFSFLWVLSFSFIVGNLVVVKAGGRWSPVGPSPLCLVNHPLSATPWLCRRPVVGCNAGPAHTFKNRGKASGIHGGAWGEAEEEFMSWDVISKKMHQGAQPDFLGDPAKQPRRNWYSDYKISRHFEDIFWKLKFFFPFSLLFLRILKVRAL